MAKSAASVAGLVLLSLSMMASPSQAGPTTCLDRLAGNAYTCPFKVTGGPVGTAVLVFSSAPPVTLTASTLLSVPLDCACETDGNFLNPQFGHSKIHWVCIGNDHTGFAVSLKGDVAGNAKLSKVSAISATEGGPGAATYIFNCTGP